MHYFFLFLSFMFSCLLSFRFLYRALDHVHCVAGRTLEIFLDYLTSFALSCEDYMFDDAYDALLTPEELLFVNEMKKFMRQSVLSLFLLWLFRLYFFFFCVYLWPLISLCFFIFHSRYLFIHHWLLAGLFIVDLYFHQYFYSYVPLFIFRKIKVRAAIKSSKRYVLVVSSSIQFHSHW
jgi:hypothetical protein